MKILFHILIIIIVANFVSSFSKKLNDVFIVGGKTTSIEEHPYQAALFFESKYLCGCVIISTTFVLTCAHCTRNYHVDNLNVRAGSSHKYSLGREIYAQYVTQHEKYNPRNHDCDITLIKLMQPLVLSKTIAVISLPETSRKIIYPGMVGNITGWGQLHENDNESDLLQSVKVPVIPQKQCRDFYKSMRYEITDRQFCAGYNQGIKDACIGDSGGPFVAHNVLLGLVSWGVGCARPLYPTVYTDVQKLRVWIWEKSGI